MDDNRFSDIVTDAVNNAFQNLPPPPAPVPAPTVEIPGVTVSAEGARRATADEQAAKAAGFSLDPPIYTIGTLVNETGQANFRQSRQDFEALPTALEACEGLAAQIKAEDRQDHKVEARNLVMLDSGDLHTQGNGTYPLSTRALEGVCNFCTPGGAGYLTECPPDLRATNLNRWFPNAYRVDARATTKAREQDPEAPEVKTPRVVTLRTRNAQDGGREIFSVVGPRYADHDADKVAAQIMAAVPAGARGDVMYDGYRFRISLQFHSDIQPEKCVAGEIFKAGILISGADDGSGSIKTAATVTRNRCLNLLILQEARQDVLRRRHYGAGIVEDVRAGIDLTFSKIGHFAQAWDSATVDNVLERYGVQDVDQVFRGLVYNKVVVVPGVSPKDLVSRLRDAFNAEPGYTKDSVINAITRAAHTGEWSHPWNQTEELERQAGRLLFAKRWNVDVPDEDLAKVAAW